MKSTKVVYLNNWYWIDTNTMDSGFMPAYTTWDLKSQAIINGKKLVFTQLPLVDDVEYVKLPKRSGN